MSNINDIPEFCPECGATVTVEREPIPVHQLGQPARYVVTDVYCSANRFHLLTPKPKRKGARGIGMVRGRRG